MALTRKIQSGTLFLSAFLTSYLSLANISGIPFIPPVYNYTTSHYEGRNQNWAIAQGGNGVIYFGNEKGLLSFDGINWQLHPLPNGLSVKSIFIDTTHVAERIYVGSFEEFGVFERDSTNQLVYHSLKKLVNDYSFHNDEIWTIYPFDNHIIFQSFSAIFKYDGTDMITLNPDPRVLYFFSIGNKMYAQLIGGDLCRFDGTNFHRMVSRKQLGDDDVVAVLPLADHYLLVTSRSGLYSFSEATSSLSKWNVSIDKELQYGIVNRALFTGDTYLFGTLNCGLLGMDTLGKKKWHIEQNNGLNNNTVLALYSDREQNIWVALDNGISTIWKDSPLSFFEPRDIQTGLVEDILAKDNRFYIATNQGVYRYSNANKSFIPIPNFDIQSWFIKQFDNQVFVGHNQGTSLLQNNRETRIEGAHTGGMDIKEATIHRKNILLESSYTSLYIYLKNEVGAWSFSHRVEGFSDLIKNVEIDLAGNIWAGHMYKGVYRIRLDEALRDITELEYYHSLDTVNDGSSSFQDYPVKVMKLRGRIVLANGQQFYTYDDIKQEIIPFDLLNHDLPGFADSHRIVSVNDHLFWFIRSEEYVLVAFDNNGYTVVDRIPYSILNNPPNKGRANVYVFNDSVSFFCLNGGVGKYTLREKVTKPTSELSISSIKAYSKNGDAVFYLEPKKRAVLNHQDNHLVFQFLYPVFSKKEGQLECLLEGYDNRWQRTNELLSLTYQNLPAGDYTLHARMLDNAGNEISTVNFSFQIKNPWYKTGWAYLFYFLLLLLIVVLFVRVQTHRIMKNKNKHFAEQENRRLAQIDRQEKEIALLKNERLEANLVHKGKQLASASMMIINHSEFLKSLNADIQSHVLEGKINRTEGNKLLKQIQRNITDEDEWSRYQENFDLIHDNFFRNLKARYPTLTPTDLKLCSLLRLNYSTKEIAEMLNLSIRGVETARYRLRKKLDLTESDNLTEFIISFG